MDKSILLVNPNYHYSFTLRDELRKLGWKADIYVNSGYPSQLLYNHDVLFERKKLPGIKSKIFFYIWRIYFFLKIIFFYKYFYVYGDSEVFVIAKSEKSIPIELYILKFFGKKLIFYPSGCNQELLKKDFENFEGGRLCANCILPSSACNDIKNQNTFKKVNKFYNFVVANTPMKSPHLPGKFQIKDRCIDLDEFNPELKIPEYLVMPPTNNLRILHSFADQNRMNFNKNVKGSPYILDAVKKLKSQGYLVEYIYLNNIQSYNMKFSQAQADIVVDQLIYGWWGSTSIECMALGKPVVCYLNASVKLEFFKAFPQYKSLPIIEATTETIFDVLKLLVTNEVYRKKKANDSRKFAELHFNSKINAKEFETILKCISP